MIAIGLHLFELLRSGQRDFRVLLLQVLSNFVRVLNPFFSITKNRHQALGILFNEPLDVTEFKLSACNSFA